MDKAKGRFLLTLPQECRARGLWGGPEPVELRDCTYVERRVLSLARVYVTVNRVMLPHAGYMRKTPEARPYYSTKNTIAYPQDPDAAVRAVCLLPEELCKYMTAQFVGSDPTVISREPAMQVSIQRLRCALHR